MIGSLNNAAQQQQAAYVNPFQPKAAEQFQKPDEKKPEENKTQPSGAASAGPEKTAVTGKDNTNTVLQASGNNQSTGSREYPAAQRGSIVDITV
ncbi:MAG: hypothetical protein H6868_06155 [Rhodospirillales bacterium]|nr:hypothetical protein [Rhodospirillales bacterium]